MAKKLFLILFIFSTSFWCLEADYNRDREPRHFSDAKVIRVKYVTGETFIKRDYDDGMEEGSVNLPVFEKDVVKTTDGRIELYIGRLNYVRLDYDTKLKVRKAPGLRKTRSTFRLMRGGMILDIAELDYEKDIEIQTPDCGIFILSRGVYRINVLANNKTEVRIHKGRAEVSGEDYHKIIRKDQKIAFRAGEIYERPYYFNSIQQDDFDEWAHARTRTNSYARNYGSRYLDKGYEDHEAELNRSGRWKYSSDFGKYVWIPYNISANWRPYSNGRWVWNPHYGYVWTSHDPWGWSTHHYGRWHWSILDGWYWIPGYRWSSAWVSWCWNDSYYGWSPLSYYNRPVIVINGRWHRHYRYRRGIPFHSRSTIIIKRGHIGHSRISRVSIRKVNSRSSIRVVHRGTAPTRRISYNSIRRVDAKGRSVRIKSSGSFNRSTSSIKRIGVSNNRVYRYSPNRGKTTVIKRTGTTRSINRYGSSSRSSRGSTRIIKKKRSNPSVGFSRDRSYSNSDLRSVKKSRVNATSVRRAPIVEPIRKKRYGSPAPKTSVPTYRPSIKNKAHNPGERRYNSYSRSIRKSDSSSSGSYRSYTPSIKKSTPSRSNSYRSYTPSIKKSSPSRSSSYRSYTPSIKKSSPSRNNSYRSYTPSIKKSSPSRSSSYRSYSPPRTTRSIGTTRSYSPPKIKRSSPSRSYSPPRSVRRSSAPSRSVSRSSSSSSRSVRSIKRKK